MKKLVLGLAIILMSVMSGYCIYQGNLDDDEQAAVTEVFSQNGRIKNALGLSEREPGDYLVAVTITNLDTDEVVILSTCTYRAKEIHYGSGILADTINWVINITGKLIKN